MTEDRRPFDIEGAEAGSALMRYDAGRQDPRNRAGLNDRQAAFSSVSRRARQAFLTRFFNSSTRLPSHSISPLEMRYSREYRVSQAELEWLGSRVELLKTLVERACVARLETLEKAA